MTALLLINCVRCVAADSESLIEKAKSDDLNSWFPAPNGGILWLELAKATFNFEGCGM